MNPHRMAWDRYFCAALASMSGAEDPQNPEDKARLAGRIADAAVVESEGRRFPRHVRDEIKLIANAIDLDAAKPEPDEWRALCSILKKARALPEL